MDGLHRLDGVHSHQATISPPSGRGSGQRSHGISCSEQRTGCAGVITAAGDAMPTSGINVTFDNLLVQTVPEPATLVLFVLGLATAGLFAFYSRGRILHRSTRHIIA